VYEVQTSTPTYIIYNAISYISNDDFQYHIRMKNKTPSTLLTFLNIYD